jgi:hypothetical protein
LSTTKTVVIPDFSGERVASYQSWLKLANTLLSLQRSFPVTSQIDSTTTDEDPFASCPSTFLRTKLTKFLNLCATDDGRQLFKHARDLQKLSILKWNPHIDDPTKSIYLGLVGIDKSASTECGAILLDLLLRCGVMVQSSSGHWELAEKWRSRRVYFVGDEKTIENVTKFVRDIQERRMSFATANVQADVFLEALSRVLPFPGDWHTGLNQLTSIFKLYYDGFLDQFQSMLG